MSIKFFEVKSQNNLDKEIDLDFITDSITEDFLSMIDEEIKKEKNDLSIYKNKLNKIKNEINTSKKNLTLISKHFAREKAVSRVLNMINTLYKEDKVISSKTRQQIKIILENIQKYDFNKLRDIEEKLSLYL